VVAAALSALHLLALAIGFSAVFARGRRLRDLRRTPADDAAVARVLQADNFWGLAALLWIATGLTRAFGRVEKTPDFYLHNGFFWVKMGLFGVVLLLEIAPMTTFIRWRIDRAHGGVNAAAANLGLLVKLNDFETALVLAIPFVAALMARGLWLF
jgi:putative membrane protein